MNKAETGVWNLVHNWCDGLQADIPDMAKRALMDMILERDRGVAIDAFEAAYPPGPVRHKYLPIKKAFDDYWKSQTDKEG